MEIRVIKLMKVFILTAEKSTKLLKVARRPLILAGGGVNIAGASELLEQVVNITHVPVVTTVMGKGAIPTDNPYYVGSSGMHGVMRQILQSANVMCSFPSEPVSTTVSQVT